MGVVRTFRFERWRNQHGKVESSTSKFTKPPLAHRRNRRRAANKAARAARKANR